MFSFAMKAPLIMILLITLSKVESRLRSVAAEDVKDFDLLAKEVSERNAKADYSASRFDSSCMVDKDCVFDPFPTASMTCCNSGRDIKTCHFICNAMIRTSNGVAEIGKGNMVNGVTASIAQGEKGQNNMVVGVTVAEVGQGGQGNMVNGITVAEVGQVGPEAGQVGKGNMVGGITVAEVGQVGQGNMVGGVTVAEVGQGGKGNMVNGIKTSIMEGQMGQKGKNKMSGGITAAANAHARRTRVPNVDASMVNGYGYEPFAQARVAPDYDYTIGRYKSILSDESVTPPVDNASSNTENDYKIIAFDGKKGKKGGK